MPRLAAGLGSAAGRGQRSYPAKRQGVALLRYPPRFTWHCAPALRGARQPLVRASHYCSAAMRGGCPLGIFPLTTFLPQAPHP